ncbi:9-cis-epoxycarotenoid dioxygenase, putative [Ricinus communis]|uniref:9-cis-epoxycarotenoid dioxygenase, putative n=1 Tax=Ricinus communis TaxID=3988 RepID=B9RRX8_RICCO|nr:9-cis-epoxycarotenoid dioxygenase, putative [Ricinus communis]
MKDLQQLPLQIDILKTIRNASLKLLGRLSSASIPEAVLVSSIEGRIPDDFQEGIYIRNGPNPLFGGLKSTSSVFGKTGHIWIEGEGMLHAIYFDKNNDGGGWTVRYNNRHVETETNSHNKKSAYGIRIYDRDVFSKAREDNCMQLGCQWSLESSLFQPPKKSSRNWVSVTIGLDATKPFLELGVISADGERLVHKVDLKFNRCTLCHDFGVTQKLLKYDKTEYARIGIMPRYGNADSICWFDVEPCCTFHILNCFEDGDEVVEWGCRSLESIISGSADTNLEKFEWVSGRLTYTETVEEDKKTLTKDELFFCRCYEWRLNMRTGEVKGKNVTGTEFSLEFPMINGEFTGTKNRYGYTQVVDSIASSISGLPKFGALAKLHFRGTATEVEYHKFEVKTFCTGATFIAKEGGLAEDDGWIVTFVHNEDTELSEVCIIDAKNFSDKPVAKITLPCRVPYGFHGAFMPIPLPS